MAYDTPNLLLVGAAQNLILQGEPRKVRSGIPYHFDDFNPEPTYSLTFPEDGWQSHLIAGGDDGRLNPASHFTFNIRLAENSHH